MFGSLKYAAKQAAKKAGFSVVGGGLFLIGMAFLTSAAWIYLSDIRSSLFAALVIGGVYCGLGLIVIAVGMRERPVPDANPTATEPPVPPSTADLVAALVQGLSAGIAAGVAKRAARAEAEKAAREGAANPSSSSDRKQ